MSKYIIASGAGNPISHDLHQLILSPLADVNATPLYAYLSHTNDVPFNSFLSNDDDASHLLAENSKCIVRSLKSDTDVRYEFINCPIALVRSGKRISSDDDDDDDDAVDADGGNGSDAKCDANNDACVLLPHLSTPSNNIKIPRDEDDDSDDDTDDAILILILLTTGDNILNSDKNDNDDNDDNDDNE